MEHLNALRIVIEGSFCSFRDPIGAKYQQTFWFPPKTTVVGFLGGALGLEPPALEPLYDALQVGVILESWKGLARDLWGFTKLKGTAKPETAVLIRELIYQPRYVIYVSADETARLKELQSALFDPVYPLRLGRGEDLALIRVKPDLIPLVSVKEAPWLRWTLLPFTLQGRTYQLQDPNSNPRPQRPPFPSKMPVRFHYDKNWVRKADNIWTIQTFDWGIKFISTEGLWTDGQYAFYVV